MLTQIPALLLTVGLLADPPAPPAPSFPLDSARTSRDFDKPPAGTPADQALWRSTYDANNALVLERHAAATLSQQAKTNVERLRDPAGRGDLTGQRAEELASPLVARWTANVELMASTWPVSKVRGCRYELLNFEGVMLAKDSPARNAQLDDARQQLKGCVEKATAMLRAVRRANEELRAANAEAERALGAPRPPPAATAAGSGAPPPKR